MVKCTNGIIKYARWVNQGKTDLDSAKDHAQECTYRMTEYSASAENLRKQGKIMEAAAAELRMQKWKKKSAEVIITTAKFCTSWMSLVHVL